MAVSGTEPSPARAGEIASQYHRAAGLPGAEQGVEPALAAAAWAESTGAHDEAARFLHLALDLLPEADARRSRLLGRLGIALAWALRFDEAVEMAGEAGEAIAAAEGRDAAAEYLSDAAYACSLAGGQTHAWVLADRGLAHAGERRDVAWARLVSLDFERRAAEDPEHPGIPLDTAERRESARILRAARLDRLGPGPMEAVFDSWQEALESSNLVVLALWAGEYSRCLPLFEAEVAEAESLGRLARAVRAWCNVAGAQAPLGRLGEASQAFERARALAARSGAPIGAVLFAQQVLCTALDEGWEEVAATFGALSASTSPALAWALGHAYATSAQAAARLGRADDALIFLGRLLPWLERAPAWTIGFPIMACGAAETLWFLDRLDHADVIERALREKLLPADFRCAMTEPRLALARLCALQGRHDEALSRFAEARRVLAEQGARPLLAIADYDEALMYVRRGDPGDLDRARLLLDAARRQFDAIGMSGWVRRADELDGRL